MFSLPYNAVMTREIRGLQSTVNAIFCIFDRMNGFGSVKLGLAAHLFRDAFGHGFDNHLRDWAGLHGQEQHHPEVHC
jgi:hypothetical protein